MYCDGTLTEERKADIKSMRIFSSTTNAVGESLPALVGNRGAGSGEVLSDIHDEWSENNREWVKENTSKSMALALDCGVKWIKVDACVARDGKVMLSSHHILDSGKAIVELDSFELHRLGLISLDDAFNEVDESVGFIVEAKHIFEDLDGWGSTESVAKALVRENILRPNRALIAYGAEASTALVMKHTIKDHPIHLGYTAYEGSDFVGMVISAKRFGLQTVFVSVKSLIGEKAKASMAPYSLKEVIDEAHIDGLEIIALTPTFEESRILIEAGVDALVIDNVPSMTIDLKLVKPKLVKNQTL